MDSIHVKGMPLQRSCDFDTSDEPHRRFACFRSASSLLLALPPSVYLTVRTKTYIISFDHINQFYRFTSYLCTFCVYDHEYQELHPVCYVSSQHSDKHIFLPIALNFVSVKYENCTRMLTDKSGLSSIFFMYRSSVVI